MADFRSLTESSLNRDPFLQFGLWFEERMKETDLYPEAFTLATAGADGSVSARTVLLKDFNIAGFVFFTNYLSRKGRQIESNSRAAMLFYWPDAGRQIRVEGRVEKITAKESDSYFVTRPTESRLGAWASEQSKTIPSRDYLDNRMAYFESKFSESEIPRPDHWGGFRIVPDMFEFWQEGKFRLHDRLVYTRNGENWIISRLAP